MSSISLPFSVRHDSTTASRPLAAARPKGRKAFFSVVGLVSVGLMVAGGTPSAAFAAPVATPAQTETNAVEKLRSATLPAGGSVTIPVGEVAATATSVDIEFVASGASGRAAVSAFIGADGPPASVLTVEAGSSSTSVVTVRVPANNDGTLTLVSDGSSVRIDSKIVAVKQSVLVPEDGTKTIALDGAPELATAVVLDVWGSQASRDTTLFVAAGAGGETVSAAIEADPGSGAVMTLPLPESNDGTIELSSNNADVRVYATVTGFIVSAPVPVVPATATPAPAPAPAPAGTPGSGNTGVPAGKKLTVHNGDLTIAQPGAVIDSLDIRGLVFVKAPNVTIKNSVIRGRVTPGNAALLSNTSTNLRVVDSEFYSANPSWKMKGFVGSNTTFTRVDIHDVTDQIHIIGDNVTAEKSWLHGNLHYANDPNNGGPTHDDNIQIQGGNNLSFVGNKLEGANNAALQITQDSSVVSNVVFSRNDVSGGSCTINVLQKARGPVRGMSITDNAFGRDTKYHECSIITVPSTKALLNVERNYYSDGVLVDVNLF